MLKIAEQLNDNSNGEYMAIRYPSFQNGGIKEQERAEDCLSLHEKTGPCQAKAYEKMYFEIQEPLQQCLEKQCSFRIMGKYTPRTKI